MMLSLIIPSRTRPDSLRETIRLFRQTGGIEIIVISNNCQETYDVALKEGADVVMNYAESLRPVVACNRGAALATGYYLMGGSDDFRPQKGWLEAALKAHQEQLGGYGMIRLNDLIYDHDVDAGIVLFDRRFCRDHLGGCLVVPHYHHLFADKEAITRARRTGHYYYCKSSVVAHLHPANGTRSSDSLDNERDTWWKRDEQIFMDRERAGFPDDFEPVI